MKDLSPEQQAQVQRAYEAAVSIRSHAYAPYSKFHVSAALKVAGVESPVLGFNIENASYGGTVCAERTAVFAAITQHQIRTFEFMVLVTEKAQTPCGMCLQVLSEFCPADFPVYLASPEGIERCLSLSELLPHQFRF